MSTPIEAPFGLAQRRPGAKRGLNEAKILAAAEIGLRRSRLCRRHDLGDRRSVPACPRPISIIISAPRRQLYQPGARRHPRALASEHRRLQSAGCRPGPGACAPISPPSSNSPAAGRRPPRSSPTRSCMARPDLAGMLAGDLTAWLDGKCAVIERWIADGRMASRSIRAICSSDLGGDPDLRRFRRPGRGAARPFRRRSADYAKAADPDRQHGARPRCGARPDQAAVIAADDGARGDRNRRDAYRRRAGAHRRRPAIRRSPAPRSSPSGATRASISTICAGC